MKNVLITGASGLVGTELQDPQYIFLKADLAKEASIRSALKNIKSLDVVINNAAATHQLFKPFEETSLKDWQEGIENNYPHLYGKLFLKDVVYSMTKAPDANGYYSLPEEFAKEEIKLDCEIVRKDSCVGNVRWNCFEAFNCQKVLN